MRFRLPQCLAFHSAATSGEARYLQKSSQCLKLAFHTKSHTMRNLNCRGRAAEHGRTRWELCALRSSSAKKRRFFVDNTDGQVDTTEGKNLFHATATTVYQRQPTIDDRTYLTKAQHPESHLSSLSMAWLLCMNLVFTKVTLITVKAFQHFLFARWVEELSDALSNSSLSTMQCVLTRQAAIPGFHTLIGADINGHRT